jgi:predicted TIM-barrel fold metal-dependent hydrolase
VAGLPKIISVDDHVIEPAHLFERWLPKKYQDRGPKHVRAGIGPMTAQSGAYNVTVDPDGRPADWWFYEDLQWPQRRPYAAVGFPRQEMTLDGMTYDEMRPGCYDPKARLDDMDANWTDASMCFPTFPRFCGQTFLERTDKEVALACVRAYNDWMVEEWCGDSEGRLIPLIVIPLWDAELAAEEIRRNAGRGVRAVVFSELPTRLGLPSIHTDAWDPFLAACNEADVSINMHIGSSSTMAAASPDAPVVVSATLTCGNAMASMADWLFSGKLVQFPNLKLAYSESQIGWIPYILERADDAWSQHRAWGGVAEKIPEPPSSYYRKHMFGCFFRDQFGVRSLEDVGVDNATFETDYPHVDSTWPDSKKIAEELHAELGDNLAYKVLRGNAIRMLSLDMV